MQYFGFDRTLGQGNVLGFGEAESTEPVVPEIKGYKWWRMANMVMDGASSSVSFGQVRFITSDDQESLDPTKALANTTYDDYVIGYAFDGVNSGRFYHSGGETSEEWISYEFPSEVLVATVVTSARWDGSGNGQELQTANIEVSSDGVSWVLYGTISPMTTSARETVTSPVVVSQ